MKIKRTEKKIEGYLLSKGNYIKVYFQSHSDGDCNSGSGGEIRHVTGVVTTEAFEEWRFEDISS
jgi:hypothetical protein